MIIIIIIDNTCPNITGKLEDIVQKTDPGSANALVSWTEPTAHDNSGLVTLRSNYKPGELFPIAVTTVEYMAEDSQFNTACMTFTVTVVGEIFFIKIINTLYVD